MPDADPARPGSAAPSRPDGAAERHAPDPGADLRAELDALVVRIEGLRARMRTAIDLLGVLLLGISGAALLVLTVLAVAGFAGSDTGIAFLFSSLAIICLPLVAFAAWRAFQPLWQLGREQKTLRAREQVLRARLDPLPPVPVRPRDLPGGAAPGKSTSGKAPSGRSTTIETKLPPGRSATGWRTSEPPPKIRQVLSTRQVGWRVVIGIGALMLLFAAGVLVGVLGR